jgi:small ligand-binding sensory domain FIST
MIASGARFAVALSEHPVPSQATGEIVGTILEELGDEPDLAVLFATGAHTGALEDVARTIRDVLRPGAFIGATAVSILAGAREVEEQPALALWCGRIGAVKPVRLAMVQGPDGWALNGLDAADLTPGRTLVVLPDPFTFPVDAVLAHLTENHPEVTVVGGLASSARAPGGNRLILDGDLYHDGAVGVLLEPNQAVQSVVSQGCRPIGDPYIVTRAEGQVIYELAGKPALERLEEVTNALAPDERLLLQGGVHLGRVIDEQRAHFGRGDFLIRNVLGADRSVGAIAVGDEIEVGSTVQFQVRDAASADEDLRLLLAGRESAGALVFTCNGRGMGLFGAPDHDARVIHESTGAATAGMFCAGEIGPIGGRTFLHGFTASVVLFP